MRRSNHSHHSHCDYWSFAVRVQGGRYFQFWKTLRYGPICPAMVRSRAALPMIPMVDGHDRWFRSRIFAILLETPLAIVGGEPFDAAAVCHTVRQSEALQTAGRKSGDRRVDGSVNKCKDFAGGMCRERRLGKQRCPGFRQAAFFFWH
jgi:hypothetical protein